MAKSLEHPPSSDPGKSEPGPESGNESREGAQSFHDLGIESGDSFVAYTSKGDVSADLQVVSVSPDGQSVVVKGTKNGDPTKGNLTFDNFRATEEQIKQQQRTLEIVKKSEEGQVSGYGGPENALDDLPRTAAEAGDTMMAGATLIDRPVPEKETSETETASSNERASNEEQSGVDATGHTTRQARRFTGSRERAPRPPKREDPRPKYLDREQRFSESSVEKPAGEQPESVMAEVVEPPPVINPPLPEGVASTIRALKEGHDLSPDMHAVLVGRVGQVLERKGLADKEHLALLDRVEEQVQQGGYRQRNKEPGSAFNIPRRLADFKNWIGDLAVRYEVLGFAGMWGRKAKERMHTIRGEVRKAMVEAAASLKEQPGVGEQPALLQALAGELNALTRHERAYDRMLDAGTQRAVEKTGRAAAGATRTTGRVAAGVTGATARGLRRTGSFIGGVIARRAERKRQAREQQTKKAEKVQQDILQAEEQTQQDAAGERALQERAEERKLERERLKAQRAKQARKQAEAEARKAQADADLARQQRKIEEARRNARGQGKKNKRNP